MQCNCSRGLWQSHEGSQVKIVRLWDNTPAGGEVSAPVQCRRRFVKVGILTAHHRILCKHVYTPGKPPSVFKVQLGFYLLPPSPTLWVSPSFFARCVYMSVSLHHLPSRCGRAQVCISEPSTHRLFNESIMFLIKWDWLMKETATGL